MARTGIVRHPLYVKHNMGAFHPESPQRLVAIYEMLDGADMAGRFEAIEPREARFQELVEIHDPRYVNSIAATKDKSVTLDPDTSTSPDTYAAALMSAGGTLAAIDAVVDGRVCNAFCLHRPPGHHAERDAAMGFCLFNNVAVGAAYAIKHHGFERVMIVDPDVHHGNGTQHSFYHQSNVLYVSTHQYPFYPGTGHVREAGDGTGRGFTVNVPMDWGYGDGDFERVFDEVVVPVGMAFKPDLVLVSAGYDAHADDPLGAMRMTERGYAILFDRLLRVAEACCNGRFVAALEGGYDITGLVHSVQASLNTMSEDPTRRAPAPVEPLRADAIDHVIKSVKNIHESYWPGL